MIFFNFIIYIVFVNSNKGAINFREEPPEAAQNALNIFDKNEVGKGCTLIEAIKPVDISRFCVTQS